MKSDSWQLFYTQGYATQQTLCGFYKCVYEIKRDFLEKQGDASQQALYVKFAKNK